MNHYNSNNNSNNQLNQQFSNVEFGSRSSVQPASPRFYKSATVADSVNSNANSKMMLNNVINNNEVINNNNMMNNNNNMMNNDNMMMIHQKNVMIDINNNDNNNDINNGIINNNDNRNKSFNPSVKFNEKIEGIYAKWEKQGLVNAANQESMAEAAVALAIHQYASKYPIYIASGSEFREAVQAQTCFHEARRADRENRAQHRKAYKEHMAVGALQQLGYSIKMYVRENKANIFATLALAIALVVLFVQVDSKITDISNNRLDPLGLRVSNVETSAAQAQLKVNGVNAQLTIVQTAVAAINTQTALANASILAIQQVVNTFNVSNYIAQVTQLSNAGIPQLFNTATSAQQLCGEAQKNFTNMQAVVLQNAVNQTKYLFELFSNKSNNKSLVSLALSSNPSGVTIGSNINIPFVSNVVIGSSIHCYTGYCSLQGPGTFLLSLKLFSMAYSPPASYSFNYGWTQKPGVPPCIGNCGHLSTLSNWDTDIDAGGVIRLQANDTMNVYASGLDYYGNSNEAYIYSGSGTNGVFSTASVIQIA
jgi:hypothetical protein